SNKGKSYGKNALSSVNWSKTREVSTGEKESYDDNLLTDEQYNNNHQHENLRHLTEEDILDMISFGNSAAASSRRLLLVNHWILIFATLCWMGIIFNSVKS
ncbi:unnamed protein product, partial [Meganyctiphanes norvegica]